MKNKILAVIGMNSKIILIRFRDICHIDYISIPDITSEESWGTCKLSSITSLRFKLYKIINKEDLVEYYNQLKLEEMLGTLPFYKEVEGNPIELNELVHRYLYTQN